MDLKVIDAATDDASGSFYLNGRDRFALRLATTGGVTVKYAVKGHVSSQEDGLPIALPDASSATLVGAALEEFDGVSLYKVTVEVTDFTGTGTVSVYASSNQRGA